jgi:hypothetical protein
MPEFTQDELIAIFSAMIHTEWTDDQFTQQTQQAAETAIDKLAAYYKEVCLALQ